MGNIFSSVAEPQAAQMEASPALPASPASPAPQDPMVAPAEQEVLQEQHLGTAPMMQHRADVGDVQRNRRSFQVQRQDRPQLSMRSRSSVLGPQGGTMSFDFDSHQNFNDDDPIDGGVPVSATSQPDPELEAVASNGVLTLSTRVEYSALPRGQTQQVFGLVTVHAVDVPPQAAGEEERQPMDIVCVLDVSGSMRGEKIRQVQDAVRFIIEQADPKDRISIVAFSSTASRVLKLRSMSSEGKNDANVAALRLTAGGGTSIASGLDMALAVMEKRRQRNKVSAILLLTDGQDGSTRSRIPALVQRAAHANCSIYAFGFGADHDAALLSQLAEQAHTPFSFVENTDRIREAFAGAVGGLTSIVAQGVELTLRGHVPIHSVHTGFAVRRVSDTESVVEIPDLFAGERRDVLVELAVPAVDSGAAQMVLLEACARYMDLRQNSAAQTPPASMEAARVEEPSPELEPDEEVTAQRERVEVARALQEATSCGDRGDFDQARRVLDAADDRMKASSSSSNKQTTTYAALMQELGDARSRLRSRAAWEQGGRAEVLDATQMHRMQRCTNKSGMKMSKAMYSTRKQDSWIERSNLQG